MVHFSGTANKDIFVGGADADVFYFNAANLSGEDSVVGGVGRDILVIEANADPTIITQTQLAGISGIELIGLPLVVTARITLDDSILAANPGLRVDGYSNVIIDASSTTLGAHLSVTDPFYEGGGGDATITGGAGNDRFDMAADDLDEEDSLNGNGGVDQLHISAGYGGLSGDLSSVSGMEQVWLDSGPSVIVTDRALDNNVPLLSIFGSDFNDRVDASSVTSSAHGINVSAGAGNDILLGGAGRDYFYFDADRLDNSDIVMGNAGEDTILIRAPGTITAGDLAHVNGIEDIRLLTSGVSLAFDDVVAAKNARTLSIYGSDGNDIVDGSAVTLGWRSFNIAAGAGNDVLKGGAAIDSFHFDIANLDAADTVAGGSGYDTLYLTGSGTLSEPALSHVSGIEKIMLLDGAAHLTLGDSIIDTGERTLSVAGSSGSDVIDASALTHVLLATGGAGDDTVIAGSGGATISGGAGADTIIAGAGSDTISWGDGDVGLAFDTINDFAPGEDKLQFAASMFHVNGSAFDTAVNGGFGADLADVDLLRTSTKIAGADDLLAKLSAGGGTAGQGLFVLAGGGGNGDLMLYYADDASGHGHAYAIADFGATLTSGTFGRGDFVFT